MLYTAASASGLPEWQVPFSRQRASMTLCLRFATLNTMLSALLHFFASGQQKKETRQSLCFLLFNHPGQEVTDTILPHTLLEKSAYVTHPFNTPSGTWRLIHLSRANTLIKMGHEFHCMTCCLCDIYILHLRWFFFKYSISDAHILSFK